MIDDQSLIVKFLIFHFLKLKSNSKEEKNLLEAQTIVINNNHENSILDLCIANAEYEQSISFECDPSLLELSNKRPHEIDESGY